jgi:hypothetical protein
VTKVETDGATLTQSAVWNDREKIAYQGGPLSAVSNEGLIALQLAAGRPQDIVDVQRLKEASGEGDS